LNITIFGTGYVGLVTGACLAEVGNHVTCVDIDEAKLAQLQAGDIPIYEPGVESLVVSNQRSGRLTFTSDAKSAVSDAEIIFIAVGTPPEEDGSADLSHVLMVAETVGKYMDDYKLVVTKSTVPVGTSDKVKKAVQDSLDNRNIEIAFDVASNPEFLKEGAAIEDFMKPDRIIVGSDSERADALLKSLYAPFTRNHDRFMRMSIRSAELTKYAANAMLATKISFINEVANLAEHLDADIEEVRRGIGSDPRIGYQFIYPGAGYGGSCFPKDVRALVQTAKEHNYNAELISSVEAVNARQKNVLFNKISRYYNGELRGKKVAVWGLAFKPKTDDMREASSHVLIDSLIAEGVNINAYDPEAMRAAQEIFGVHDQITYCGTPEGALKDADCLVIVTEWNLFRSPNFSLIKEMLTEPVIFDGRNLYDLQVMKRQGFTYYGIGRSVV